MSRNRPCGGSSATSGVKRSHQSAMSFSVLRVRGLVGVEHRQFRADRAGIGERQADRKAGARRHIVQRRDLQRVVLFGDDNAGDFVIRLVRLPPCGGGDLARSMGSGRGSLHTAVLAAYPSPPPSPARGEGVAPSVL